MGSIVERLEKSYLVPGYEGCPMGIYIPCIARRVEQSASLTPPTPIQIIGKPLYSTEYAIEKCPMISGRYQQGSTITMPIRKRLEHIRAVDMVK